MKRCFFIDAAFDKKTHLAFIGFCNLSMIGQCKRMKVKDNNVAEFEAILFCLDYLKTLPFDEPIVLYTDSLNSIETVRAHHMDQLPHVTIEHRERARNIADAYIRAYKESYNVRQRDIDDTKKTQSSKASTQAL